MEEGASSECFRASRCGEEYVGCNGQLGEFGEEGVGVCWLRTG